MAGFAQMRSMDVWYACLDEGELIRAVRGVAAGTAKAAKGAMKQPKESSKRATASALETHLPNSRYRQHGERVVQGQRLMQAASDEQDFQQFVKAVRTGRLETLEGV